MQRRKFLLGMGSLAAGGAAAMGTGAFQTTRVQGNMSVKVSGNSSANLGIDPNTDSEFVSKNPLSVDLTANGGNASGLNQNALTEVRPAFELTNNFSSDLYIEIINPLRNTDIATEADPVGREAITTGNNKISAPDGLDIQFVAADPQVVSGTDQITGNARAALIDRNSVESYRFSSNRGGVVNPGNIKFDLDSIGAGGNRTSLKTGYIELTPGNSISIIIRAIVDGFDGNLDEQLAKGPFVIRAFDSDNKMYLNSKVATIDGDSHWSN